jgi:heme oxygenase
MVQVPEEFRYFTRCFLQGSLEEAPSIEAWIEFALHLSNAEQQAVIKSFLDDILVRKVDGPQLQRIWDAGAPSYGFDDDNELRQFLTQIRDSIK